MSYIGNQPVLSSSEFREEFAVTSTQTVFNTGGFTASSDSATLEVLRNGVLLGTADYTLGSDASTVTLANAAVNGDIIVIKGRRELTNGVQVTERRHEHTIASGETTVTFPYPLTVSQTDVYLNGVKLGSSDFSINSSTRVVSFTANPAVGDLVAIVSREPALTANSSLPVVDAAGNNVLSESGGVVTLSNISIGSITDQLGSLSNPYTNIDTLRTNLYSTKSNGDIDYLYFSDGRDTIQLYVFWLTVNGQMNAYVLVGGGNDGSDATSYSRHSTIGAYPKGFPLGANDTSTDNRVFANFHIGFNFVATLAQASADYIAGIDAFGNFGTTYINNSSWWDNVKNQVCDDASVTNVASSGNFYKGTFSQSSNITASDTGTTTETNSASVVVGYWDTHYYYSNPGGHVNADGVWFGNVPSSTSQGKDGLIFIR